MTLDKETLSQLKEGTLIEFKYHPLLLGIGPEDITAEFVRANPENNTITVRRLYFDPVPARGAEDEINYKQVSNLETVSLASTGPR